ncbi:TatD family hydrolase [Humibacter ginsenosidimutans]|uniref:TatD family deoxyribonuclease n=1 Tax=Humibacter ginsenosidimutans TaxID=2599293 RepID=A0A5B8M3H9_9MICO|nr:TatD family hydrolase [Humibacter ginsenosidimutans]QDZ14509.1 TatD family deoxyribonuclease [Humibacter ginsenosidimutans]
MPSDPTYPPLPTPLTVPVYDNHTHIDPSARPGRIEDGLALEYREQLDRASSVGVRGIVQVGTDVQSSIWAAETAAIEPRMLAAVAIHPNDAPELEAAAALDDALAVIDGLASRPRVRAIGETGLDFFRTDAAGRGAQFRSFEAHIDMAKRHGLALQIHDRDAHDDVIATLQRVGAPEKVVFHCFSGGPDLARVCADNGWYMSFAGTVTFKNAQNLRDALELAPRALLLVETDAPYLTPTPYRGRPNAPYLIPHTLRTMAEVIGTDASVLAAQIASNTELVYGRWDDEPVAAPPTTPIGIIA